MPSKIVVAMVPIATHLEVVEIAIMFKKASDELKLPFATNIKPTVSTKSKISAETGNRERLTNFSGDRYKG